MNRPRLTGTQINLMIYMALHCGAGGSVFLPRCKRDTAVSLARRGLLAIWYRQAALWPTPRAHEVGEYQYSRGNKSTPVATLTGAAQHWQTPSVADTMGSRKARSGDRSNEMLLNGQSETISRSIRPDQATSTHGDKSPNERLVLNPLFVEWLMGWPEGWTAFECSATALTRFKQRMRFALSQLVSPDDPPQQLGLFA